MIKLRRRRRRRRQKGEERGGVLRPQPMGGAESDGRSQREQRGKSVGDVFYD